MNSTLATLSSAQLQQAVGIKVKIEALEQALAALLGAPATPTARAAAHKPKRRMSAAGRKRIAAAARARWAKLRAAKADADAKAPKKRKFSAAARARMAAAAKARWAKVKAAPPAA